MKKQTGTRNMLAIMLVCSVIMVIAMSFQDTPAVQTPVIPKAWVDTPGKSSVHIDIDMKDLNKALDEINIKLKNLNLDISKEIELALNSVDMDKIKKDVDRSLQNIDWEKIKNEVKNEVKDINLDEIKLNIKKATDEIRVKINSDEFRKNMENLKKTDKEKIKKEIRKAQKEIEQNKEQIRKDIDKIKREHDGETTSVTGTKMPVETTAFPEKDRLFFLI